MDKLIYKNRSKWKNEIYKTSKRNDFTDNELKEASNATLAVTGATEGTSSVKLFEELLKAWKLINSNVGLEGFVLYLKSNHLPYLFESP